ncbi:MAG: hypothetical protein R2713_17635 [Ilumatobacteraceae bacterium]
MVCFVIAAVITPSGDPFSILASRSRCRCSSSSRC